MASPGLCILSSSDPELLTAARAVSGRLEVLTAEELKTAPERLAEVEVVFGGLDREQLRRVTRLRWIQVMGAGVDGLLTPELLARGIVVTNASGIHAEPIAEHLFGMLLMWTRRLAEAWDQQKERRWARDVGGRVELLAGKTLGVLGVGAIGGQCARVGRAFGMRVLGLRRTAEPHADVERMYGPDDRLAFFAECDVVMNLLPLTPKTRGFVGAAELAALPPGAILLNAGRGATVETAALLDSLRSGHLGAALLDVTDPEPLPEDHPLWGMERVVITPHYSGAHPGYSRRAGRIFLENLRRYVAGAPLLNVVDPQEGY